MKINKHFLNSIEAIFVVLLLINAESLNLPPFLDSINNIATYIILAFLVIGRLSRIAYVLNQDKVLMLLVGLALVSILWSQTPSETFNQMRGLARTTILGVYLATRYSPKEQVNLLCWTTGIAAVLSLLVCILNPSYGIGSNHGAATWQGIYKFKQYLGRMMALGVSVFLVKIFSNRRTSWFAIVMTILVTGLLLLSKSKTGLIMLIVIILVLPLYKLAKQQYLIRTIVLLSLILIGAITATLLISNMETIVVNVLGKDLEFNGRTEIWTLAVQKALERPWLGYGYVGFWGSNAGQYIVENTWGRFIQNSTNNWHAHNGFLELVLELGFVGLLLLVFDLLVTFIKIIKILTITKQIEFLWMLQFLAIVITWNMSEAITFVSSTHIFWIIQVSVVLSTSLEYNKLRRNSHQTLYFSESSSAL